MRVNSARRDGLSLLEVLVSLAIFLMALVALTQLINNSSNLAAEGQHRARAAQLARSKMNELSSGALQLQSQPDGSFDDEPDFRWSAEVGGGATSGLFNVTVTVTYRPDDPFPVKVALSRMILDPKVSGSTQDVPASPDDSAADSGTSSSGSGSSTQGSSSGSPSSGASGMGSKGANTGNTGSGSKGTGSTGTGSTGTGTMGTGTGSKSTGSTGTGTGTGSTGTGSKGTSGTGTATGSGTSSGSGTGSGTGTGSGSGSKGSGSSGTGTSGKG